MRGLVEISLRKEQEKCRQGMSWITNFVRPKIKALITKKDVPDNLWQKCPGCDAMLYHQDLIKNLRVCHHCGHHLRMGVMERLEMLFDEGQFQEVELPKTAFDPLKFKDRKKYTDRLKDAQSATGRKEARVNLLEDAAVRPPPRNVANGRGKQRTPFV